jgi:hypothetical protein
MSAPVKKRPVVRRVTNSAPSGRRSSALRGYIEYVRRHAPEGVPKLEAFIQGFGIVGMSSKELPIPYGDHQATFRRADGILVYTSQPYQRLTSELLDAYTRFAFEHRMSGSISPHAWWDSNTCLITFLNDGTPGRDLYFLQYELAALYPRIADCSSELVSEDPYKVRPRVTALLKDVKRLKHRVERAFGEIEAAR